ncbi:unnamed protein product [Diatraea saccharalis]|uniref:Polynucleotide 5'-hydroxyl-kinase NOL9 n=1 Tax=Diatraea saccharalis TaxID=40085 RepID=A0A9P0G467_9NEOP|nr:unnamed protein product [Diatraea saccharalis]
MDFENTRVVKKQKQSSRKDNKSEGAMKKQLKQMLFGYKRSDSKLIKNCVDSSEFEYHDDSSSVSGFSDLNLTNSSNDAVTTRENLASDDDVDLSDIEEDINSKNSDNINLSHISNDSSKSDIESISEYKDNNLSLSDDMHSSNITSYTETNSDISIISSLSGTSSEKDTENSDFDADGELAMKILDKLGKHKPSKKSKKRKLEIESQSQKKLPNNISKEKNKGNNIHNIPKIEISTKHKESEDDTSIEYSNSPAFISVDASDMSDQKLSELLGDYKYPTIKNLPTDIQIINSTNKSYNFTIEDMNIEDIKIQEEVDSITSECDYFTSEANIETTDNDVSIAPTIEDVYDDTESISEKEMSIDSVEENCQSPIKYYYGDNCCIFVLKYPAELFIHGKVHLKALGGSLDLFGFKLNDEVYEIYAPNYNYAHCLKTIASQNLYNGLFSKLTAEGLSVSDAEEIVTTINDNDGVISLSKLNNQKMDFVESNMPSTDLFDKVSRNVDPCLRKVSETLGCSLYSTRQGKSIEEVTCWRKVAEHGLSGQSRGIVCGGKGVGKSTFLRYYVNKLVSRGPVLVVDLDPGQAEFTVAGNISATVVDKPLLGPNFTHLKTPHMMLNLGMINTMDNPRRYATAVSALISHCCNNEQLKSMPWIINTMGLCNAMGLKFMVLTILQAQPTHLLQIDSKNPKHRFEMYLDSRTIKNLYENTYKNDYLFKNLDLTLDFDYSFFVAHHTENPVKKNYSLPARDERYLNFLAYFGDMLVAKEQTSLLVIKPYEVNLKDLHIGLNVKISEDAVTKVINGKIVALCQLTTQDKVGDVFTLGDKPVLCHGHGMKNIIPFLFIKIGTYQYVK